MPYAPCVDTKSVTYDTKQAGAPDNSSYTHSLQRWVSTKYSISQLEWILIFTMYVRNWYVLPRIQIMCQETTTEDERRNTKDMAWCLPPWRWPTKKKRGGKKKNDGILKIVSCSHVNSNNQVRGHRTGSGHSGWKKHKTNQRWYTHISQLTYIMWYNRLTRQTTT